MPQEINLYELPLEAYHGKLPFPLIGLVKRLIELKANIFENILIDPPNSDNANQLINELSKGPVSNWNKYGDVSSVAYVFKNYLTKLLSYEPLIPIDCFTVISTMGTVDDIEKKINLCQSILSGLLAFKKARYALIDYIFHFFKYISDNSSNNCMDANKIAESFTPIITHQDKSSNYSVDAANQSVAFIIENYEAIFKKSDKESDDPSLYEMSSKEISSFHVPIIDFNLVAIAANNCRLRKDHIIKFIPSATISRANRFKRPQRAPPPKPVTSTQLAINMFDSTIQRFNENDANKNFLLNVRHSVTQLNPMSAGTSSDSVLIKPTTQTVKPSQPSKPYPQPPKNTPSPPAQKPGPTAIKATEPPKATITPVPNSSKSRSSQTTIGNPSSKVNNSNIERSGTIKDRAKFLNIPMGAPMGGPMPPNRRTTVSSNDSPQPMGMPMGAPRPKVTKDDEDTPINVVVESGQMIHRTPRRGGNRRPPKILTEG